MTEAPVTFRVGWGQRVLGLVVLAGIGVIVAVLGLDLPWLTWLVLGVFGVAALVSTVSNFGERVHAEDAGLRRENVLLRSLGLDRARHAPWDRILTAVELDRKTLFLTVEGQGRWVLDALDGHEELCRLLRERGVRIEARARPRFRDLGRGPRDVPPS